MCSTYLGFLLLFWFPGRLHAQSVTQSCSAPILDGGVFVPKQEIYSPGTQLNYTCNDGRKPAAPGWWATSTCENGIWSDPPQCIDGNACFPPNVENGKASEALTGWHLNGELIKITCDEGYETKSRQITAKCENGKWSALPSCEKGEHSCGAPPKLPHAVIIRQRYREVFAVDSQLEYECEAGYTTEEGHTRKSVYCISGSWTEGPTCTSSTGSGSSGRELQPVPIRNCGKIPNIENGDIVGTYPMFLRYQCSIFYSPVGSERVLCYSNGKWSKTPTCKAAFCALNTEEYPALKNTGLKFIKNDETISLECEKKRLWLSTHFAEVQCTDGEAQIGRCCGWIERETNGCI